MVGIYGVVGYVVAQRTMEIGVRMALGASPSDVVRLLALQGTRPILWGIGVGTALAFVAMRLLRTAVYGVSLTDPMSLAAAAAMLFLAGLAAALVPARRAMRVDPAHTIMRG
jgi:putative ABC transport system permease protein